MKTTIETMMAVAALALATGNVKADLAQDFQNRLADEAKLEFDFKQQVELTNPGFTVFVTPGHLSIFGPYNSDPNGEASLVSLK